MASEQQPRAVEGKRKGGEGEERGKRKGEGGGVEEERGGELEQERGGEGRGIALSSFI